MLRIISGATFGTALAAGIMAGVFYTFSSFVMPGLARLAPNQGIAAMQAINAAALGRWFLGGLVGTAIACLVLGIVTVFTWNTGGAGLRLAGCLAYLVGAMVITMLFNVPRNEALDALVPDAAEAAITWARYLAEWSAWNHARGAVCALASGLLLLAYAARP